MDSFSSTWTPSLRLSIPRFPPFVHPMLGTRSPARNRTFTTTNPGSGGLDVNPARTVPRGGSPIQPGDQYVNTSHLTFKDHLCLAFPSVREYIQVGASHTLTTSTNTVINGLCSGLLWCWSLKRWISYPCRPVTWKCALGCLANVVHLVLQHRDLFGRHL